MAATYQVTVRAGAEMAVFERSTKGEADELARMIRIANAATGGSVTVLVTRKEVRAR